MDIILKTLPQARLVCKKCKAEFIPDAPEQIKCHNCATLEEMIKKYKK